MTASVIRHDWTFTQVYDLYHQPFMDLLWQAQNVHRENFPPNTVQLSYLMNIKVGGCPEDCQWCGQSVYSPGTGVKNEPLADIDEVVRQAQNAKDMGVTRFCMAASWRGPTSRNLAKVMRMIGAVKDIGGMETCITIGRLTPDQARELKSAGLDYYNHNLESSESHFAKVTTTRPYSERLETIKNVREAGINVCSGGIMALGETEADRLELLRTLANQTDHPQSVPINQLVRVPGTPLADAEPIGEIEFARVVATARIMMPKSFVRLSGGRVLMSQGLQALCFMAGANSIHYGNKKLLVTPNVERSEDEAFLNALGIHIQDQPFLRHKPIPSKVVVNP